ncbi:MAG: class I SAM-dependent methyltransferase [Streptosporangiaceae bacterium]
MSDRSGLAARPAFYDDSDLNYLDYWSDRDYEHHAEVMAIRRLLGGLSFRDALDIGGGYGRLSVVLSEHATKVTLIDSSSQQIELAHRFLIGHPRIECRVMDAAALRFKDQSFDLVTLIRVLHHLPDPADELREMYRVLRPGGYAVVEVANSTHAINRVRYLVRHEQIPLTAINVRSARSRQPDGIPFVNHHPHTIISQLTAAGFAVQRSLSVSNLRHPALKKALPLRSMLLAEKVLQKGLARVTFGPSLFLLLRKRPA